MAVKVLLTGGRGMVGRNFLTYAENSDDRDITILAPPRSELDLLSFPSVEDYIESTRPDIVVHAAGVVGGIQANLKEPLRFYLDNLDMGRNLIVASAQFGVPRLINLGSSCMYPRDVENPLHESSLLTGKLEPTNEGYALAKIATAKLCDYVSTQEPNCSYKTLIPCNLYGPHDKFDPRNSHLIPAIIHKIYEAKLAGESSVEIWGDGSARREFMYAADLAGCIYRAIREFDALPAAMNVGVGSDYSVKDYYEIVADVVGFDGHFTYDLDKPVGMARKLVDVSAANAWGWSASTSLEDGLAKTFNFYREIVRKET